MDVPNILLVLLQGYFLLMNFTVERSYCLNQLDSSPPPLLAEETIAFCQENNRLFLARPEWMVRATCVHSFVYPIGYFLVFVSAMTNSWRSFAVPLLLFVGAKANAIFFYHYMEFTSDIPPENLVPYFSVEGPYILSMILVVLKVYNALYSGNKLKKSA